MEKSLPNIEENSSTCETLEDGSKQPLHSILVNSNQPQSDDDFFKSRLFRPRANTDPVSPRPRLHVHFDLPDIVVDDCSDNEYDEDDGEENELANTNEGAFFVFKSPPRQRSNTCPTNMFSTKRRQRRNRPPTPPPPGEVSHDLQRYPSWERVGFSPHALTSVEETREISTTTIQDKKSTTTTKSETKTRKISVGKMAKDKQSGVQTPKRSLPKLPNGHVTSKQTSAIDISG